MLIFCRDLLLLFDLLLFDLLLFDLLIFDMLIFYLLFFLAIANVYNVGFALSSLILVIALIIFRFVFGILCLWQLLRRNMTQSSLLASHNSLMICKSFVKNS